MKYHTIGIAPEDAQFLETRKYQVNEICRIFRDLFGFVLVGLISDIVRIGVFYLARLRISLYRHELGSKSAVASVQKGQRR